jgi:hypothetical protein
MQAAATRYEVDTAEDQRVVSVEYIGKDGKIP